MTAVGAVLLAAGSATRLGGKPKCLLELEGVPLIRRLLDGLLGAGVVEVVVVLGHYSEAIEAAIQGYDVKRVQNPRPDDGQPSSVRIGVNALARSLDAVLIALADQPLIEIQDVAKLIKAFEARGATAMVVPRVTGADEQCLPGNPIMFDAALRNEWQAGDVNAYSRRWREVNPERVHWFDTKNIHYRVDIDTEEDIARFAERTGRQLQWPQTLTSHHAGGRP